MEEEQAEHAGVAPRGEEARDRAERGAHQARGRGSSELVWRVTSVEHVLDEELAGSGRAVLIVAPLAPRS